MQHQNKKRHENSNNICNTRIKKDKRTAIIYATPFLKTEKASYLHNFPTPSRHYSKQPARFSEDLIQLLAFAI